MLLKQNSPKVVTGILFTGLLTFLTGCGNSSAIESMLKPDPQLVSRVEANTDKLAQSTENLLPAEDSIAFIDQANQAQANKTAANPNLPPNFPASFPIYPQVELQATKIEPNKTSGILTWTSPHSSKAIADYYQAELTARDWDLIKPFTFNPQQKIARAIAVKDEQRVDLTLFQTNNQNGQNSTKLLLAYQPLEEDVATSGISQGVNGDSITNSELRSQQPSNNNPSQSQNSANNQAIATPNELALKNLETSQNNNPISSSKRNFTDLNEAPEQLNKPLETISALGILTPYTNEGNVELTKFAPNAIITRGEYARWLIAANNYYYQDNPGKKIYVSHKINQAAFQDIKADNPDFAAIQGLAEAGLVPSRLTQDSTKLLFRPNAPLTREDLVTWKVPLDSRQALPKASIEAIQESWGFQDAADIDSSAIRALYTDFQNGDMANVRRIFGFTTLFQPKKPVTRAEAAASLWYFGFQGDGITAQEILEIETGTTSETELESNS